VTSTVRSARLVDEQARASRRAPRRGRSVAVAALWLITAAFLAYQVPPYFSLDPTRSRIPIQFPLHYVFLAGHVISGTVALSTICVQFTPWVRRRYPAVHHWSGHLFVFGGALPSAFFALAMFPVAFQNGSIGAVASASLWSTTAVIGWIRGRQGRYREHGRWMLYSFAIVWGEVVFGFFLGLVLLSLPHPAPIAYVAEAARWVGFVGGLVVVHWYLERRDGRTFVGTPRTTSRAVRTASVTIAGPVAKPAAAR